MKMGSAKCDQSAIATKFYSPPSYPIGINDKSEIQDYLTNPLVKDTDGDGFEDDFELFTGFDHTQASSSPDSRLGVHDQ